MFDLERHTVFVALGGSHAHGTAGSGSDVDLRGVCIAPLSVRLSLFHSFEQHEGPLEGALAATCLPVVRAHPEAARGLATKAECVVFDVAKLLRLCVAANPNALEILFVDPRDWILERPPWRRLHEARHRFLTRKVQQTFLGYAMAQLRRIETHRTWLLRPPSGPPSRAEYGLPERSTLRRDDAVVATRNAEKRYRAAMRHWDAYRRWKAERNPTRAALEQRHGYDTKHAMHLVRLMRMGLEILRTGELLVHRPDAEELVRIREGALDFGSLLELATELKQEMTEAAEASPLPTTVDRDWVDALALELMEWAPPDETCPSGSAPAR